MLNQLSETKYIGNLVFNLIVTLLILTGLSQRINYIHGMSSLIFPLCLPKVLNFLQSFNLYVMYLLVGYSTINGFQAGILFYFY